MTTNMTVGELRELIRNLPDDAPIEVFDADAGLRSCLEGAAGPTHIDGPATLWLHVAG